MERVYRSRYSTTFRLGLILSWGLVLAGRSVYGPPAQSGRTIQPASASLPIQCNAGFQLTLGVWATNPALPPAPHFRAAAPPHRRQKALSTPPQGKASLSIHTALVR